MFVESTTGHNEYRDTKKLLSDAKFFEGYARYDDVNGRYETWTEAVDRVMRMHKSYYKDKLNPELLAYIDEATEAYENKRVLGAQRALQFGGEQLLRHQVKMYNCTSSYADRAAFFGEVFYILLCGAGAGFSVQKHHIAKLPKIIARTKAPKTHVVEDSIEGWATAMDVLMSSYFEGGGKHPEFEGRKVYFDLNNIRPKGAKISGGFKAPGPEPLRLALDKVEYILQGISLSSNRVLRPIHVYDIVMYEADAVLAGGVRRSATICLFSPDDTEMATAKTGDWYVTNPQRGRSNNSAVIVRKTADRDQFHQLIQSIAQFGEPGFVFVESTEHTTNPCVSGDTILSCKDHAATVDGETISEGVEYEMTIRDFTALFNADPSNAPLVLAQDTVTRKKKYCAVSGAQLTRKDADIIRIELEDGKTLKCTPDHKIYTNNRGYVEAKDLMEDDDIVSI